MGTLWRMNRNLLSKLIKPTSQFSSSINLCFFRRVFSEAAAHAPSTSVVAADINIQPNSSKPMFLIDHLHNGITTYSLLSVDQHHQHHRICSPFSGKKHDLVESCKEWTLFWLWDEDSYPVFSLWNTTTNHIKTPPPPWLARPFLWYVNTVDCFGFGFDPKSRLDYKIVRFRKYDHLPNFQHIELYTFKTDKWKPISPSISVASPKTSRNSIHVNGVYYWASDFILAFDFADEDFFKFPLPDDDSVRKSDDYCLAEFHGSLAVIVPYSVPAEDLTEEEKQKQLQQPFSVKIWVWNGETWDVGPRVAVGDFPVGDKIARAMGLFQNEYLFLLGCAEPELMLFNCKTGKLEKLGIRHDPSVRCPNVFPFTVPI